MITTLAVVAVSGLLLKFLYAVLILAVVGGLIYCVEHFICPIPQPIKLILAIICIILIVIAFLGGGI